MPENKKSEKNFVIFRKMRYICSVKYPGRIFDDKNDMQHVQFTYSYYYYLYSGRVKAGVCVL